MLRILYEHPAEWPEEEPLLLDTQLQLVGKSAVSPGSARRRANAIALSFASKAAPAS